MILERLRAERFRNFVTVDIALHPEINVIWGDNAQGKTNLLEAAYYAVLQHSFRQARARDLIMIGHEQAQLAARIAIAEVAHDVAVNFTLRGRTVTVDDKGVRGREQLMRGLSAVIFSPEDLSVPRGAPQERRRLVDEAICGVWSAFYAVGRDYQKVLSSRNRCLKEQERNVALQLEVYDVQLARLGATIIAARRRYLARLAPRYADVHRAIAPSNREALVEYRAHVGSEGNTETAALEQELAGALAAARAEDLARRQTSVGPHHDDLLFVIDGQDLRRFGSQGQLRTAVLAFKIAQIADVGETLGHQPLLLLDDVSSELDAQRNAFLFAFLSERRAQLLVSSARPELLALHGDVKRFQIVSGKIQV